MDEHRNDNSLAIETIDLTYKFSGSSKIGLEHIDLQIPWGTTNLIVGPNGAGKSTLLKILAGKTLVKKGRLRIGGFDPFDFSSGRNEQHNADINNFITYLGTEWAANSVVKRDIAVQILISSIGGDTYKERRDILMNILDIDPEWSMLRISDGERRRVQICMGLVKPWKLLLLDEVTIDLDVVVRSNLLKFLRNECQVRDCCVIYATHIFDGLGNAWCDRIIHLCGGEMKDDVKTSKVNFIENKDGAVSMDDDGSDRVQVPYSESFHPLALHWLHDDLVERGSREDEKIKMARRSEIWDQTKESKFFDADEEKLAGYFKATRGKAT